jgi:hypothetical protein
LQKTIAHFNRRYLAKAKGNENGNARTPENYPRTAERMIAIPVSGDGSHRNARRRVKESMLKQVAAHERMDVDHYLKQALSAMRKPATREWYQTNSMLFAGKGGQR